MTRQFLEIVLLGDSVSWSNQLPYGQRYADFIEAELQERFGETTLVDVAACGDGGNTAEEGLARIERDCIAYSPHAVVISFGTNDACRGLSRDRFMRSYRTLVEKAARDTGALVVLETLPTLDEERHSFRNSPQAFMYGGLEKYLEQYSHSHVREISRTHKLPLHERFAIYHQEKKADPAAGGRLILPDGAHFTREGNRFFAHTLVDLLYPVLSKNEPRRSSDAAHWLDRAGTNVVYLEACAALETGKLAGMMTNQMLPVRLMLQQCRSFARRAYAYAEDPKMAGETLAVERLATGFLAAQRAYAPFNDEARRGSAEWGIEQLKECTHPLAAKLRETLNALAA